MPLIHGPQSRSPASVSRVGEYVGVWHNGQPNRHRVAAHRAYLCPGERLICLRMLVRGTWAVLVEMHDAGIGQGDTVSWTARW